MRYDNSPSVLEALDVGAETGLAGRRPPTGASARSLLFTVLGEFYRGSDRQVWASTLVTALDALGVGESATRQALTRTVRAGWLRSVRHGRRIRCELTQTARAHLADSADEVYRRRREPAPWDGRWCLLVTSVPETRRDLRHRLRTRLRWVGFGALGQGVWISPRTDAEPLARQVLEGLGLAGNTLSMLGQLGTLGTEHEVVARAWDLAGLGRDYSDFLLDFPPWSGTASADAATFAEHVVMLHRWREFALRDPVLPGELLPPRWPGHPAAERFHSRHEALGSFATSWIDRINDSPEAGDSQTQSQDDKLPTVT